MQASAAQPAGATPPAASSSSGGIGAFADKYFGGSPEEQEAGWGNPVAAGMVKSAGSGLGGLIDLVRPQVGSDPESVRGRVAGHMKDAADWLRTGSEPHGFWEHVGAIGEQTIEFVGTDGLLKMAGAGLQATQAGKAAIGAAEELKAAQQVAATLKANPKLAGLVTIGLKAAKDALGLGAQTYVHTEDPQQAAIAGAGGAILSGAAGLAGRYLQKIAPKNLEIAGEKMPALASQVNEAGEPIDTGARGAPAIAQAQQQGAAAATRNVAQQATAQAIDRINQTRPEISPVQDPTRLLPSPEGSQPFTFSIEGTGQPSESVEGELTSPAKEIPRTHTSLPAERGAANMETDRIGAEPEYIQPAGPGGAISERTGRSWVNRRTPGYMHTGPEVEGAGDTTTTGHMQTTNPAEATGWLRQLEDLQGSPEFGSMPEAQQKLVRDRAQALNEQLALYHRSPYAQRFAQANVWDSIEGVRTFGDAADQIEAQAQPVYATLDQVSGGAFNAQKEIAKRAEQAMRNPGSEEAYQNAQNKYRDAVRNINDLINTHRSAVSTADYMTARTAWGHASRLNELHAVFESMMNGVTLEQSDRGMTRVMTGNAKRLESYLADGSNREQLKQLIGTEGLDNLTRITLLLKGANTARMTQGVADHVAHAMDRGLGPHVAGGGWAAVAGAAAGGGLAHMFGLSPYVGAVAGAVGARQILRIAATSPAVGNMVEYAVRNNVSPQIYAPLIARIIAEPFQQQKPTEEEAPDAESGGTPASQ
jgi:hypothetical protein